MPMTTWNILYRGSLSSCNYACHYCPFAKTSNTLEELAADAAALNRFVEWVSRQTEARIGILITPWGEALIHRYYRAAMVALSWMPHVYRIAIQTNLSGSLDSLERGNLDTLALWTTCHPTQTTIRRFLRRCRQLDEMGIRYSVGMVGLIEHLEDIERLRELLPPERYLWVNAFKRAPDYYNPASLDRIRRIDPYFGLNSREYQSVGKSCRAGHTAFTVDAKGTARRCHFIDTPIGNIYEPRFADRLKPQPCTAADCRCYIGTIHRPEPDMDGLYGDGILERVPQSWPRIDPRFTI